MLISDGLNLVRENNATIGNHSFRLSYNVSKSLDSSDINNMIIAEVYNSDCKPLDNNEGFTIESNVTGGQLDVFLNIDSESIDNNVDIFKVQEKNGNLAKVSVCVVVRLKNGAQEVIRKEVKIDIELDMKAEFEIVDFGVINSNPNAKTGAISFDVVANVTSVGTGSGNKYQQGDIVSVKIEVKDDATLIDSIANFTFRAASDDCYQDILSADDQALTVGNSDCEGQRFCSFHTILKACFFLEEGLVSGAGAASLRFKDSNRRLIISGDSISNASDEKGIGFSVEFDVISTDSASYTSSGVTFVEHIMVPIIAGVALACLF